MPIISSVGPLFGKVLTFSSYKKNQGFSHFSLKQVLGECLLRDYPDFTVLACFKF
jgi:hypothetical protein